MTTGKYHIEKIHIAHYPTPCGCLLLGSYGQRLCLCDWYEAKHRQTMDRRLQTALRAEYAEGITTTLLTAIGQLDEYFGGRRTAFSLPLLAIGTPFQRQVWQTLPQIPYGETVSYAQIATMMGNPKAVRAVAAANGANPIAIIIPCHRVIGSDNSLTGYAGGVKAKRFLLELERSRQR